jgi:ribosomal protein S18 acetylase RimI-like enzyme
MQDNQFRLINLDQNTEPLEIDGLIEQLVALMTRMYDYHASLHSDWQTHEGWQQGSTQWLKRSLASEEWLRVLLFPHDGNTACGYILASFHYEAPLFIQNRFGYIADLWIDEKFRGSGGSELLLNAAFDWFRHANVSRLQLEVDLRNQLGKRFWDKHGFEDSQIVMRRDLA